MEHFVQYIETLLQSNTNLCVPDFGTFERINKPAYIKDGCINPSTSQLVFDSYLKQGSPLLAEYTASQEGISIALAEEKIQEWVKKINHKQLKGETLSWGNLGSTSWIENQGVVFKENPNYPFPLGSPTLKPVPLMETIQTHQQETPKQVTPIKPEPPVVTSTKKTMETPVNNSNKDLAATNTPPKKKKTGRIIFMLIALVLVVVLLLLPRECIIDRLHLPVGPFGQKQVNVDTIPVQKVDTTTAPIITSPVISTPPIEKPKSVVKKGSYTYHIIVGSCVSLSDAKAQRFHLTKKGYKNISIIKESGARYRLSYQTYSNQEEAEANMLTLSNNDPLLKDAWILRKRN